MQCVVALFIAAILRVVYYCGIDISCVYELRRDMTLVTFNTVIQKNPIMEAIFYNGMPSIKYSKSY